MIDNIKQLHKFIKSAGVDSPNSLIPKLAEKKELISPQMAKLITDDLVTVEYCLQA